MNGGESASGRRPLTGFDVPNNRSGGGGGPSDAFEGSHVVGDKRRLVDQVLRRIPGDSELREDRYVAPSLGCDLEGSDRCVDVVVERPHDRVDLAKRDPKRWDIGHVVRLRPLDTGDERVRGCAHLRSSSMARVAIIGSGYVGLVTGAIFADRGHDVVCSDNNKARVNQLNSGSSPIFEPGLDALLATGRGSGRISFVADNCRAADRAEFVFLCLPTPAGDDGAADLSAVEEVSKQISSTLATGAVVVTKSTVPMGTTERVQAWLGRDDLSVASNPEFLREGCAIDDFLHPDRIVIGSSTKATAERVAALYDGLGGTRVITDNRSAELMKYATNAFLAMKLSFVNAIDSLAVNAGADSRAVLDALGADSRISPAFMQPGPGFGGSCFPKDVAALVRTAADHAVDFSLLRSTADMNEQRMDWVVDQIESAVGGSLVGKTVAALGIAFKANTDDVRASPSVGVIRRLSERGAEVLAYDPQAVLPDDCHARQASSIDAAVSGSACIAILTEWSEFASIADDAPAGIPILDLRRVAQG